MEIEAEQWVTYRWQKGDRYYVAELTQERLIVKIKSHVSENEIYDDFAKIYRRYKVLNRRIVGDYFFKETGDIVDKLCDDFEASALQSRK